jgi:DNA adenine methylase
VEEPAAGVGCDASNPVAIRPPLKWAGGKRWLVQHLAPLWNPEKRRRLVEPFSGGLAVTLGLIPKRALLNDINPHTINFYVWLKRGLRISIPMRNDRAAYYEYRTRFNELVANRGARSREAAALFYYLNRTCYNGLCRFNRKGVFNVPYGRYTNIQYKYDFTEYKDFMANWDFRSGDFEALDIELDDFIYADPPYDVEFTQYARENFSWEDQERLARWIAAHRGPAVISNQATDRIVRLYCKLGFRLTWLKAPRLISCTGDRTPVYEVLGMKNLG